MPGGGGYDFRGGPPPELQQLGGVGQQAQPQVPGLLQMAQAAMDSGGGDVRGSGLAFGGDPRDTAQIGPPPGYNPGSTVGGYNAIFDPRAPSANGGWFTMDDYLGQAPTPMQAALNPGSMQSPQMGPRAGATNNKAPSTNNWRLLGNDPDQFMINGTVVRRRDAQEALTGKSVMGQEGGGFPGYWSYGGGTWATPVSSYGWNQGYIGGQGGWGPSSTPTY